MGGGFKILKDSGSDTEETHHRRENRLARTKTADGGKRARRMIEGGSFRIFESPCAF